MAEIDGVPQATVLYRVRSLAQLYVQVAVVSGGEQVTVEGVRFLPRLPLLIVAYPLAAKPRPIVLGSVRTDRSGRFTISTLRRNLAAGQYELRAWSTGALTAQMGEAFFSVVD